MNQAFGSLGFISNFSILIAWSLFQSSDPLPPLFLVLVRITNFFHSSHSSTGSSKALFIFCHAVEVEFHQRHPRKSRSLWLAMGTTFLFFFLHLCTAHLLPRPIALPSSHSQITTSLVFMMAASSNFAAYLKNSVTWQFNFLALTWGSAIVYGYCILVPIAFWGTSFSLLLFFAFFWFCVFLF